MRLVGYDLMKEVAMPSGLMTENSTLHDILLFHIDFSPWVLSPPLGIPQLLFTVQYLNIFMVYKPYKMFKCHYIWSKGIMTVDDRYCKVKTENNCSKPVCTNQHLK